MVTIAKKFIITQSSTKMKRKLDEKDVPTPIESSEPADEVGDQTLPQELLAETPASPQTIDSFEAFRLDPRLLQAVVKEGLHKPTDVQAQAIPLALEGRDILGSVT